MTNYFRRLSVGLLLAAGVLPQISAAIEMGAPNTVYRVGASGGRPRFGTDLRQIRMFGFSANQVAVSTTYTSLLSDDLIVADPTSGAFTVNLLTAAGSTNGKIYTLMKSEAATNLNAVTVDPNGSETVGGLTTTTLNTAGEWIRIQSNGTNWLLIGRGYPTKNVACTVTGSWNTNVSYLAYCRRQGPELYMRVWVQLAGQPNNTTLSVNLPSGYVMDTSNQLPGGSPGRVGTCHWNDSAADVRADAPAIYSSTTAFTPKWAFNSTVAGSSAITAENFTQTSPKTWVNTDLIMCDFHAPIVGWN